MGHQYLTIASMARRSKAEIEADKHRTGRPPLLKGKARSRSVRVRLTPAELTRLKKRAKAVGVSVAAYIRKRLLEE